MVDIAVVSRNENLLAQFAHISCEVIFLNTSLSTVKSKEQLQEELMNFDECLIAHFLPHNFHDNRYDQVGDNVSLKILDSTPYIIKTYEFPATNHNIININCNNVDMN